MENNWPEAVDELLEECQLLISRYDLYELGERGQLQKRHRNHPRARMQRVRKDLRACQRELSTVSALREKGEAMSMLSGQIDELRLMGDGQAAKGEFTVATLLREAADTIESLRERLKCETCKIVVTWKDSDYIDDVNYSCSECGGLIVVDERNPDDYFDVISHANYCCNCGRRVIGVKR